MIFLFLLISFLFCLNLNGQVTIGGNLEPKNGAILDLKQQNTLGVNSTKGLVLPRVIIDSLKLKAGETNLATTIRGAQANSSTAWNKDAHIGLTVYNVNDAHACKNGTFEGVYVWTGVEWRDLFSKRPVRPALGKGTDQYEGANTYIVKQGSSVDIPVKRAFDIWSDYTGTDVATGKLLDKTIFPNFDNPSGHMSVSVVWEEAEDATTTPGSIISSINLKNSLVGSGSDDFINVVVGDTHTGNALIALRLDGDVIWQWQIWVPADDPTVKAYGYNNSATVYWFMDRNLGAIDTKQQAWTGPSDGSSGVATQRNAHGLYYQWGRPTPMRKFGSTNLPRVDAIPGNEVQNLRNALQTPFFIKSGNPDPGQTSIPVGNILTQDWYTNTSGQWLTRWGNATDDDTTNKSGLDPCPQGWRVPAWKEGLSPWHCLENSISLGIIDKTGYDFTELGRILGFYPVSGYRARSASYIYDIGNFSGIWTATSSPDHRARRLFLSYLNPFINSQSIHYMANGLSVRCVQDN